MDKDEVTREPFEDLNNEDQEEETGSVSSWQQSKYESQEENGHKNNDLNSTDKTLLDQSYDLATNNDNDSSSSICAEDIDYAKSFGIQLKNPKVQASYQKLMNTQESPSASMQDKPLIKTSTTSDCIYHKGFFYQKGDIVALCDQDDGQIYFAQLTGFLQDQYCEKSASVNWLVPNRATSRRSFDPSAYRIGLEDVQLRKLDCMTFICRCPHDYYLRKFLESEENQPSDHDGRSLETNYKSSRDQTYIWTTMRPCSVPSIETLAEER